MENRPDYIVVGRFGRPRGVSGEIFLNKLSDNPERLGGPGVFRIESDDKMTEIEIISIKDLAGRLAVKVKGIDTVEQAKELTNKLLFITSTELGDLPEGQYYYFELIGCEVTDPDGNRLGEIVDIEDYPANEVWVIEEEGQKFMFPAVSEFVVKVDIENRVIKINPPEGIFDSPDED